MANKPGDIERVNHMINAITKIFSYTENLSYDEFYKQDMVQDAVMKNFEIIGEASYHISKEFKAKCNDIEWKKIEGLRHVLVHDYYKVNPEILWNTKDNYLNDLQIDLEELLESGEQKDEE